MTTLALNLFPRQKSFAIFYQMIIFYRFLGAIPEACYFL